MSTTSWPAVVVPSTPLLVSPLGAERPAQIGTPASKNPEMATPTSRSAATADPLGEVRDLAVDAVRWLVEQAPWGVLAIIPPADPANVARGVSSALGERVARSLLAEAGFTGHVAVVAAGSPIPPALLDDLHRMGVLVVGDGSARRGEKAPGHLDERSFDFDKSVEEALLGCAAADLADLSLEVGAELLAAGVPAFRALGALPDATGHTATLDYSGDPFGVQYWIVRWQCAS